MTPQPNHKPPKHLSREAKAWFRRVAEEYELDAHHGKLLQAACEAWDETQAAREVIAAEGMIVDDRFGQRKEHPAVRVQNAAAIRFARLVRELALDVEPPGSRPPRTGGQRH